MKNSARLLDLSSIQGKRWVIIGDIHGCMDQLEDILIKCNYNKNTDILIALGDLIDRGPKPYEVLKFFMSDHNIYTVQGNHDNKLCRFLKGNKVVVGKELRKTLEELENKCDEQEREVIASWLGDIPHIIRIPNLMGKPAFCVHAGFSPNIEPEKQDFQSCIYIRGINPKNYMDETTGGIWYEYLDGSYYVISGHIVSKELNPHPYNFAIDAGCSAGLKLRAMIIENGEYKIMEVDGYKKPMEIPDKIRVIEKENGEKLLTPDFGVGNDSWSTEKSLWCRSLHIGQDDKVISCGWPKFFNINDGCEQFKITENDLLRRKDLIATLKLDGSMLCRFVHNGIVRWRTRGSTEVGLDNKAEINSFLVDHPKLADPNYYPNSSLLFEWTSPDNQVVIKYDIPEITLIGCVIYGKDVKWYETDFNLLNMESLKKISEDTGVPIVKHFNLKNEKEIQELIKNIKENKEIEGYVIRWDNCQKMVKIKSKHYLILHSLRSNLKSENLIDLWLSWDRPDFCVFQDNFEKAYDYETWVTVIPAVSSICDGIKIADKIVDHIIKFVEENRTLTRKNFAELVKQKYSGEKLNLCFALLDRKKIDSKFYKKIIMQNIKMYDFSMFKKEKINNYAEE